MKLLATLFTIFCFSIAVEAQNQSQRAEIRSLLEEMLKAVEITNATQTELSKVRDNLIRARDVLRYGDPGGTSGPDRRSRFICVSRDNDGRPPFQLAFERPTDFAVIKIAGAIVDTQAECELQASATQRAGEALLTCVSKDSDGKNPYAMLALNTNSMATKKFAVFATVQDCNVAISRARISKNYTAVCGSRDGDGRNPFTRLTLETAKLKAKKADVNYPTLEDCLRSN
ncbi:MAG: hypothetical protein AB7O96_09335 [Pseudobdellovibrionaceae bacterium]